MAVGGAVHPVGLEWGGGLVKRKVADWSEMARSLMNFAKIEVAFSLDWAPWPGDRRLGAYEWQLFLLLTANARSESLGWSCLPLRFCSLPSFRRLYCET